MKNNALFSLFKVYSGDDIEFYAVPKKRVEEFKANLSLLDISLDAKAIYTVPKSEYKDHLQEHIGNVSTVFEEYIAYMSGMSTEEEVAFG